MNSRVVVLTTGGTISQRTGPGGAAVMEFDPQDLASEIGLPRVDLEFRSILHRSSKDITPADWKAIAAAVAAAIATKPSGIVILHGTDTLHYTAAALSFMLRGLGLPVVMTGSMRPGGDAGSDSLPNLRDAIRVAVQADFAEVCIVFSADAARGRATIIRGNRARKMHSHAIDAFASINAPPLGFVDERSFVGCVPSPWPRSASIPQLDTDFDPNVSLVKLHPAMTPPMLARALEGLSGVVLEGTGIGHLPRALHATIAGFAGPVVMSTQTVYGGERLGLYATDGEILDLSNLIQAADMSSETAMVKLMWALKRGDVRAFMQSNVAGELDERSVGAGITRPAQASAGSSRSD